MNLLPTRSILGAGVTVLAAVAAAMSGAFPLAVGLISAVLAAALAFVAFGAQSERLRDERRLVYRPVYARRQGLRRRVGSDD